MESCHISDEFSKQKIEDTARKNKLLTLELELSLKCNFNCPYCYVTEKEGLKNELTYAEVVDILHQTKNLGAKRIILLGGEPTIHENFFEVIDKINSLGLQAEIFTNGSQITQYFANKLYQKNVKTVLKLNSFNRDTMWCLTGRKDSLDIVLKAIENLKNAGYPDDTHILGASSIISRQNKNEIPVLWKWMRDNNIMPYFEMLTPQGNAIQNKEMFVNPLEAKEIFKNILEIDKKRYGKNWDIQPPLLGGKCMRLKYSCLIDSVGNIRPCVGLNIPVGNIRDTKISDIIKKSEIIQAHRNHTQKIKEPCRSCEKINECYGCRGAAYHETGDPFASDPFCWRNQDALNQIYKLPYPVEEIIPQKYPIKLISSINKILDRIVFTEAIIKEDSILVDEEGVLSESAYIEIMAQSVSAMKGFEILGYKEPSGLGFLIGIRKMKIFNQTRAGDKLSIKIYKDTYFGDFGIVKSMIFIDKKIVAEAELKIHFQQ